MSETKNSIGETIDPNHKVRVEPSSQRARVEVDGQVLAESNRTLLMYESDRRHPDSPPQRYYPPDDVRSVQ